MNTITRRTFLRGTLTAATASMMGFRTPAAAAAAAAAAGGSGLEAELVLEPDFDRLPVSVPADFLGLSFETQRIADDDYLVPESRGLVRLVRALGKAGVIRIGGNSSDRPSIASTGAI